MPTPLSRTSMRTLPPRRRASTSTVPSGEL
jgi:hypothetical protein